MVSLSPTYTTSPPPVMTWLRARASRFAVFVIVLVLGSTALTGLAGHVVVRALGLVVKP